MEHTFFLAVVWEIHSCQLDYVVVVGPFQLNSSILLYPIVIFAQNECPLKKYFA